MNKIEKIKAFYNISSFLNNSSRQKLKEELNIGKIDNLENRISGLRAEDELLLILFFLECCNNIVKLEESISLIINPNSIPADLSCTFKHGLGNTFIEVKKTDKDFWKISRANFQKRKNFAQSYKIPLYFAIRIRGFWGLFSSEYLEKQDLKIEIKDYKNNLFDKFTDNFIALFPQGIQIKSIYSKSKGGIIGVKNRNYGNLIYWEIKYKDRSVAVNKKNKDKLMWNFVMEPVHDYLSNYSNITQRGDFTTIEEKLRHNLFVNGYLFFLSIVQHTTRKEGDTFNASSFLKQLIEKKNAFYVPKKVILAVLYDIESIVPLIIFKTKID